MSQRDGFASGFLTGAIVGSVVGGIVGALVAYKREPEELPEEERQLTSSATEVKKQRKSVLSKLLRRTAWIWRWHGDL